MRRLIALLMVFVPLSMFTLGCGGEPKPQIKHDPNWKDTSNPSNIVVPDSMKKMAPAPAAKK